MSLPNHYFCLCNFSALYLWHMHIWRYANTMLGLCVINRSCRHLLICYLHRTEWKSVILTTEGCILDKLTGTHLIPSWVFYRWKLVIWYWFPRWTMRHLPKQTPKHQGWQVHVLVYQRKLDSSQSFSSQFNLPWSYVEERSACVYIYVCFAPVIGDILLFCCGNLGLWLRIHRLWAGTMKSESVSETGRGVKN